MPFDGAAEKGQSVQSGGNRMGLHVCFALLVTAGVGAGPDKVTLYLQDDTALLKAASPTADVVTSLRAGDEVTWQRLDSPKKGWFRVAHGDATGFVQRASLSSVKPNFDTAEKATTISEGNRGIASSGAANKSAAEEAHQYADARGLGNEIGQLEKLEGVARKVDLQSAEAHAKKVGLVTRLSRGGKP
jgi:hypothetical protein